MVSLFCKDVAKLTPINIVVLKYKFLHHVFGSGSMYIPYTVFMRCAKEFYHGCKIGPTVSHIHLYGQRLYCLASFVVTT
jgi:hypothetical protein